MNLDKKSIIHRRLSKIELLNCKTNIWGGFRWLLRDINLKKENGFYIYLVLL